jgi:hypothetical protein
VDIILSQTFLRNFGQRESIAYPIDNDTYGAYNAAMERFAGELRDLVRHSLPRGEEILPDIPPVEPQTLEELLLRYPNLHVARERIGTLYVIKYLTPANRVITQLMEPDELGEFAFASRIVKGPEWGTYTHHVFKPVVGGLNLRVVNPQAGISTSETITDVKTGITMWDLFLKDTDPYKASKYHPQIQDQTQRTDTEGHISRSYDSQGYWTQIHAVLDLPLIEST